MTGLRKRVYRIEILLAVHLGTLGEFWAASAAHRLKKLLKNQ